MSNMRSEFASLKSDVLEKSARIDGAMQVMGVGDRWRTVQMVEDGSGGYPGRTPSYRQRLPTQQLEGFPPAGGYPPASVGGGVPRLPAHQLESFPPAGGYLPASVGGGAPRLLPLQFESYSPAGGYPPASAGGGAPPPPTTPLPGPSSNTAVPFAIPPFVGTMTPEIYAFMRQNQQLFTTPSKPPNSQ